MNPAGIKPETLKKYERILKLKRENPEITITSLCERLGLSKGWFKTIEKRLKEQMR